MKPHELDTFFKRMFALGVPKASWNNYNLLEGKHNLVTLYI